jgi:hypothetical protein
MATIATYSIALLTNPPLGVAGAGRAHVTQSNR